jgi:RimJ/RimL family protein N-acetyltransferase
LADYYNEPVNRALMTNDREMSPADVVTQFEAMAAEGGRPFLLYVDGGLIGDCDFRHVTHHHAEFAIMIGPRQTQARGLGTRFTIMATLGAFGPMGLSRVYASIRPENAGSLRMFEKVGYRVDASAEARRFAEAPDDVCVSIDLPRLRERNPEAFEQVVIVSPPGHGHG